MMLYVIYLFIPFKLPREDPYLLQTRGSVCVCVCVCTLSEHLVPLTAGWEMTCMSAAEHCRRTRLPLHP